ncbi:hypothetical protein HJG54_12525 [Leptolyngbya sp. NK1-12]|uniref:Uncharacterized protein n=1 Tax=Leptolyngbya sp. NK1-12 TaxID=2547451 RepID=A0AA97AFV7_9CYAN|nr:hypothetical protein [Leptolyngbya sp. NK1-12]WNZ23595.1 hypothetical protein HJG54_12525 [Leptolyngbya sp. NK1-12]
MVRAVEQIERELAALDQTVAAIAQAFHTTYQQYLAALGKATRQQLVLAGYHICTHAYPDQFLELSLNQRQELQQTLQQLAKQGQTELLECLKPITAGPNSEGISEASDVDSALVETIFEESEGTISQLSIGSDSLQLEITETAESETAESETVESEPTVAPSPSSESQTQADHWPQNEANSIVSADAPPDVEIEEPIDKPIERPIEGPVDAQSDASLVHPDVGMDPDANNATTTDQVTDSAIDGPIDGPIDDSSDRSSDPPTPDQRDRPLHPKDIARWQTRIEAQITEILQNLSHTTNRVLQQADILPNRLPEPVLEVAAKADLSSETANSPPNLLNLLIEASSEDEDKPVMTPIVAIRLRLSEIEFSDAATAAVRSKLRQLMGQLVKLERDYQRKQKERAVAQAESAWRASWFEAAP